MFIFILIYISIVTEAFHSFCADFPLSSMTSENRILWRCTNCKICECCGTAKEDDGNCLVYCECCDRAYHMLCVVPVLEEIPLGHWFCQFCVHCQKCEKIIKIENISHNDGSDVTICKIRSDSNDNNNNNNNGNNIQNIQNIENDNKEINDNNNDNNDNNYNNNNHHNTENNDNDDPKITEMNQESDIFNDFENNEVNRIKENCIEMETETSDEILIQNATKNGLEIADSEFHKNGKESAVHHENLSTENVQRSWGTCLTVCLNCEQ